MQRRTKEKKKKAKCIIIISIKVLSMRRPKLAEYGPRHWFGYIERMAAVGYLDVVEGALVIKAAWILKEVRLHDGIGASGFDANIPRVLTNVGESATDSHDGRHGRLRFLWLLIDAAAFQLRKLRMGNENAWRVWQVCENQDEDVADGDSREQPG
jgi:hypothetical protein